MPFTGRIPLIIYKDTAYAPVNLVKMLQKHFALTGPFSKKVLPRVATRFRFGGRTHGPVFVLTPQELFERLAQNVEPIYVYFLDDAGNYYAMTLHGVNTELDYTQGFYA